jgi:endo-1,4-beta-mannosidase
MAVQETLIVSMDDRASSKVPNSNLSNIVLTIAPEPDNQWVLMFEQFYQHLFSTTKRKVSISGNKLTVTCLDEELQAQITQLQSVFRKTNTAYAAHMEETEMQARRDAADAIAERQRLADLANKLKF